jgi:hypothetical protein
VEIQELADEYRNKSDEELLQLALVREQLTPEARAVLSDELSSRKIGAEREKVFQDEAAQLEQEERKNPGRLWHFYGIGRDRFGKAGRTYSSETGMERFKTTVFIVLFWFPLIPTGTFLVERKRAFLAEEPKFLERLPLDWEQVLSIWVVASIVLLLVIWAFKLLPRVLFR